MNRSSRIALFMLMAASASPPTLAQDPAREKPLERRFTAGEVASYRIQLRVRIELAGQQTTPIGGKTYVQPVARRAEAEISWTAMRKVLSIAPEGSAEVEESISNLERAAPVVADDTGDNSLAAALKETLARWPARLPLVLRYRETPSGQVLGLRPEDGPSLDEAPPRLVSLWLLRALRPAVALPARQVRPGESWLEPRSVQLENWDEIRASEAGEWLALTGSAEPALRLHTTQQISGRILRGAEKPPEGAGQGTFHGETLVTLSLEDARLLAATRSASREISWTLEPVEGLPERPQFRARLSVEVQIQACEESACSSSDRRAGSQPR